MTDFCPLPGLATYMGESGGYSISVHVYLTSLADARIKWGSDGAARLWDYAAFRIISGGTGTAKDLAELSDLVGKYRGEPALSPEELRTMPVGRAAVVADTARPVEMWLTSCWKRRDQGDIEKGRQAVEEMIQTYVSEQSPAADGAGLTTPSDNVPSSQN